MIDCRKCRHWYVTWDAAFPWGCHKMGFKARQMPSAVVARSTGSTICLAFQPRKAARRSGAAAPVTSGAGGLLA